MFCVVDPCVSELVGDARQLSPSAQEALRLRAVAALVAARDRQDVAAVFRVSLKAVDSWWAKWLVGGREPLVAQLRGRRVGEHQVLDAVEQRAIRQAVLDHRPCDLGLAGQLWTRAGVGDLIAMAPALARGPAPVRTQSAGHPIKTAAPHRQPTVKGQVSDLRLSSPQVTDPPHY